MEQSKHIDEEIRQKLDNLEVGYDPNSWDRLAHRMDFEAQQEVDDLLINRLGGMNAAMMPSSWDALEQLIEADEAVEMIESETDLDNLAYDNLHDLQVPFKQHHWALMAKRLEEEFSIRHQLYRYKVAEMALMALLILTIIRFMPLMEGWMQNEPTAQLQEVQQHPEHSNGIENVATIPQNISPGQQDGDVLETSIGNLHQQSKAEAYILDLSENNKFSPSSLPTALADLDYNQFAITDLLKLGPTNYGLQSLSRNALAQINYPPSALSDFEERVNEHLLQEKFIQTQKNNKSRQPNFLSAFEEKAKSLLGQDKFTDNQKDNKTQQPKILSSLALGTVESEYAWELPSVKVNPSKNKSDLRFSIFTTTDLNYVTTPPDQISVFGQPVKTGYNETVASGYGGGVNISWKKNRWEYQTGGIYSFKRYIPNTPIFIFETINFYIKEDFNGIQLDIFQLPLNALYHFKNTGKWHFYASAGVSSHFVTSTVYEFEYQRESLHNTGQPSSPDDTKSIKQQKDFPNGLIDGGKLQDNFFMSANLGLGVERYLSPKWTLFFQPNYQHFMMSGGIGTNKDKIYTTSFYFGTKFNLK